MIKEEALKILPLFHNLEGYKALHIYVEMRIESIKKELLVTESIDEIRGLQKSAQELTKMLTLREKVQGVLNGRD
jgi:hypothetical protein